MAQRTKQVTYTVYIHKRYYLISAIFFKVMKSPKDASLKLEGERHSNGIKIDSTLVQVSGSSYDAKAI